MAFEWINEISHNFLKSGYLVKSEEPLPRIRDICDAAEEYLGIEGFSDKMYDYMGKGWISLSSPVWSNYGRPARGFPVSCFGGRPSGDSVADILYFQAETAMLSKMGGGTSGFFGDIRPRGSDIKDNGKTSGPVHFMQLFDTTTNIISQGGVRRGRMAPYMPVDAPDIMEFLDIMTEGNPIQTMTTGITVDDSWMEDMINKKSANLKTWAKVLRRRKEIGVPYVMYKDNINRNKPDVYKDKNMEIVASNLCVSPETKILTDKGYMVIGDLEGQTVNVWNGQKFTKTIVRKTGENQKLVRVRTTGGADIECTPYHKFYVKTGYGKLDVVCKEARELEAGDKLIKPDSLPVIQGEEEYANAYANGFYCGDGCLTRSGKRIYLYHEKRDEAIKKRIGDIFENWYIQDEFKREYGHSSILNDKFDVPMSDYTVQSRLEWFAGLCDSDGTVSHNGKTQSIQIGSINKPFLEDVQMMLQTLGVSSKLNFACKEGYREMPLNDGSGGHGDYYCQEAWRLMVGQHELSKLLSLGLRFTRLEIDTEHTANRECIHFNKVVSVEDEGRIDDTFCFTEKERSMGMFNGLLTGQCSEIALPSTADETFVCVLSSVNLENYDEWKDTDLVETMTMFLDTVAQETIDKLEAMRDSDDQEEQLGFYYMKRAYNFVKRHRALGLGSLGYHSYLQRNMIPFESQEAREANIEMHRHMFEESQKASKKLAEMFGEPEILEGYGRRNTTTLAIAPTTSSATILGQTSQSIEPWMSNNFIKTLAKMKVEIKNNYLSNLLEEKGHNTSAVWDSIASNDGSVQHLDFLSEHEKNVFKTFREIDQYAIIDQAADRQEWLDQTQSLNLMLDSSWNPKDINRLMIHAWKKGICTLYYQHSVNAAQQAAQEKNSCQACEA